MIVCSRNLRRFVKSTLSTILDQKDIRSEIIVIDGASTDGTLSELASINGITWISEPDLGYADAFLKGLKLAGGEFVTQCAISDGYLDTFWLSKAVTYLREYQELAAVWGFPRYMSESGEVGAVSYSDLYNSEALIGVDFFEYWLRTGFWMPEGNLVAHRSVIESCFPVEAIENPNLDPWLEFNYRFHSSGFLAGSLRQVASYGRIHSDSIGQSSTQNGLGRAWASRYWDNCQRFRYKLLIRGFEHRFKLPDGRHRSVWDDKGRFKKASMYLRATLLNLKLKVNARISDVLATVSRHRS